MKLFLFSIAHMHAGITMGRGGFSKFIGVSSGGCMQPAAVD